MYKIYLIKNESCLIIMFILCLLAFISCQKDIIDIGKCIYNSPKVKELVNDFIVAIATKDFSKLWQKIKESLPELIQVVIGCVTKPAAEEKPELKAWWDPQESYCRTFCSGFDENTMNWKQCFEGCMKSK